MSETDDRRKRLKTMRSKAQKNDDNAAPEAAEVEEDEGPAVKFRNYIPEVRCVCCCIQRVCSTPSSGGRARALCCGVPSRRTPEGRRVLRAGRVTARERDSSCAVLTRRRPAFVVRHGRERTGT